MSDYSVELEVAIDVARRGARLAMDHFGKDVSVRRKKDGTWVTEADRAAESQIRSDLARAFPDHNVLGEEEGLTAARGGPARSDAPTWVIDPIDGTNNYVAGIPIWATLVGLRVDGEGVVGAVCAPGIDESYDAGVGLGARMNGSAIRVDPVDRIEEATVLFADAASFLEAGMKSLFEFMAIKSWRSRGFGDFWGHVLVARGAAHVMVETTLRIWDVAALEPIVSEAGGRLTKLDGAPFTDHGSCLTTNGALHDEVVAAARGATDHRLDRPSQ